ncbi:PAS-domain containing protein [Ramlibacter sp. XY19]|uniref:PAS-domain containing protein n=1 Tax=Ramlibacter paludis TaxID=2908000 RepID=UPI0023DBA86C|nr:PAS-domain containing protein [Ramlibacter paludis]MCG2593044.1 PAS-domain containing protein [Ramlibacter paludis]
MHAVPRSDEDALAQLKLQAALLDGLEIALLAFDPEDRTLAWNQTYLRLFPEQAGHIFEGEDYVHNLRRFYQSRLAPDELADIDRYIEGAVARHHAQTQPFEFEHHGTRLRVSSLASPGRGRVRVWRTLAPLPATPPTMDFGATLGGELLEYVPEGLVVCDGSARVLWANASFCTLFGLGPRAQVTGATLQALYAGAWMAAHVPADDPRRQRGAALLQDNIRFAGAPFELPLPARGYCRVIARPARDGTVFYALIDISALKQYEEALQLTLDNAGRGILRYDAQGRVLLFNRQALDLLDLPEHVVAGSVRIMDVIRYQQERGDAAGAAGPAPTADEVNARLFTDNSYLRRTRDGKALEIATRVLPDGGAVRTYSDVTDYVHVQQAVAEKTRALEITLDSMSQGISAIDPTGRLVFWNRRYQELLDLPDHVLAGEPTMDRLVRFQIERGDFGPNFAYVDAVARGYVAVGDKLAPLSGPETYVRKTRDGRSFDVTTKPLPDGGVVRTFTDITAYAHTQEELVHKQAQLGALVHNLPDRVWLKDVNGTFLLANPAFQRRHGLKESDIVGRRSEDLFGAETARRQGVSDQQAMESANPVIYEDHQFDADGELRFTEVAKVAMRDEEGRALGLLGIARDITRRKQEEAALIRAKEEAQLASGAKSRFLSSMSHEIRTPMNAVLGMLSLLRTTELTPSQEEYAGKAEGAARALLSLLNDILDFSKIEAGQMRLDRRPFSLEQMLADLSVILSSNVGDRDLEVLYDLDPQVPDGLVGDDMRLRQILINLGGNAVKFTERGEVVISTRLAALEDGHASIEFSVQDSGIGITPEQQQKLFGEFVQASEGTARKYGGTGLGLGICRRLTELMDAKLELASTPGVGSRFWFTVRLPLDASPHSTPAPAPARRSSQRVLIVDDNPLARDTLASLCRAAGWEADTAQDGAQALLRIEGAAARGLSYEAVFVDWVMAGMDGWQTCARIRSLHLPDSTPLVIMVTAHGREMLESRSNQDRSLLDGFLVKPVTAGMLRAAVQRFRQASQPSSADSAASPRPGPLAGLRLLVAEDNPVNQQIARELLVRQGAQVDVAENGELALDAVASGTHYDAVLMDVQMPVMDGLEATRALRARHDGATLPIIAMTANAMDNDREACLAAGMNQHVAKPFAINDVVAVILQCINPPADAPAQRATSALSAGDLIVFDRADAVRRMGGDEDLLRSVLPVFRGNLEDALRDLETATGVHLAKLMHSIKGMAANVSAKALAAKAAEAEHALRARPQIATQPLVRRVQNAIEEVLKAIG